jgi:thiol:disulfide interchange protein DsbA
VARLQHFKNPLILSLLALSALAACSSSTPPPAATDAAAAPAAAPAPATAAGTAAPAAATPDAAPKVDATAAAAAAASAAAEASPIETAAPLAPAGQLPATKWVAGKHYVPLSPAQPTDAPAGKVEVLEVFWYACPHCYALDPALEAWRKTKADYIAFRRVPVTWEDIHRQHGRLFYTLEALGKEQALHGDVFETMHSVFDARGNVTKQGNVMYAQNNPAETLSAMVQYAKSKGIAQADFMGAWNSFTVQSNMQRADDLVRRYRVEGVPTIIINGKYVTDEGMAGGPENIIRIINDLAASERPH